MMATNVSEEEEERVVSCHRCEEHFDTIQDYREHCRRDEKHLQAIRGQRQAAAAHQDGEMDAEESQSTSTSDDEEEIYSVNGRFIEDLSTSRRGTQGDFLRDSDTSGVGWWEDKNPALSDMEHVTFVCDQLWKGSALAEFTIQSPHEANDYDDSGGSQQSTTEEKEDGVSKRNATLMLQTWKSLLPQTWPEFARVETLRQNGSPALPIVTFPPETFLRRTVYGYPVQRDIWAVILFSSGHFALSIFENKVPHRSRPNRSTHKTNVVNQEGDGNWDFSSWLPVDVVSAVETLSALKNDSSENLKNVAQKLTEEDKPEVTTLFHKTLHKYTTRKKQGGFQSAKDATGAKAMSMGAQIRRNNEVLLATQIHELLASLRPILACCGRLFIGASRRNMSVLYGQQVGGQAPNSSVERAYGKNSSNAFPKEVEKFMYESFEKEARESLSRNFQNEEGCVLVPSDERIRKITFVTGRPTYQETQIVYAKLRRAKLRVIEPSQFNAESSTSDTPENSVLDSKPRESPIVSSSLSTEASVENAAPAQWRPLIMAIVQLDLEAVVAAENVILNSDRVDYAIVEMLCRALVEGVSSRSSRDDQSWRTNAYAIAELLASALAHGSEGNTDVLQFCHCLRHFGKRYLCDSSPSTASSDSRIFLEGLAHELKGRFREHRNNRPQNSNTPSVSTGAQLGVTAKDAAHATSDNQDFQEDEELDNAVAQAEAEKAALLQRQQMQMKSEELQREIDALRQRDIPNIQNLLQRQTMKSITDPDVIQIYTQQWKDIAHEIWETCIERRWEPTSTVHSEQTSNGVEALFERNEEQYYRALGLQELLECSNSLSDVLDCLGWNTGASFCAAEAMPEDWLQMLQALRSGSDIASSGFKGEKDGKANNSKKKKRSNKKKKR